KPERTITHIDNVKIDPILKALKLSAKIIAKLNKIINRIKLIITIPNKSAMDCTKIKLRVFLALKKILIPIKIIKIKLQSILVTPFIKKGSLSKRTDAKILIIIFKLLDGSLIVFLF